MADNSKFVLRWEIDNAAAVFAAGMAESGVFNEGGFRWTAKVEGIGNYAKISLRCGVDHSRPWKCQADMNLRLFRSDGTYYNEDGKFVFDENNHSFFNPAVFNQQYFTINNKVTVEFVVHVISSEGDKSTADMEAKFGAPNNRSDVILKIGDKKLHVSKEYLAVQSPFFENLFFGDYAEKGKEEVEIKEVIYEEFLDLLNVVYLVSMEITDRTVLHILKLADRFEMKVVLDHSLKHLTQSKGIDVVQKLAVADQHGFFALKNHCLNSFTTIAELTEKLKSSPEVDKFSDEMNSAILRRIMKLKLQ